MKINLKQIAEALRNKYYPKVELKQMIEEVSRERYIICQGCPYNSENSGEYTIWNPAKLPQCNSCSCILNLKTACLSCNCGNEQWNLEHPDDPKRPIMWEAILSQEEEQKVVENAKTT